MNVRKSTVNPNIFKNSTAGRVAILQDRLITNENTEGKILMRT